ncbi:MAG TPA: putative glycoside hydrolase [Spirochaetota bacterium]|nr:putative glycoside hydrolase [Spirochaetota bacterium]HOR44286.1 putative glycoside hydrolase [Spirochaetota bacterium]HOU85234.1 putative glycoside hydrolase [Spirochaetota bacterium]HPK55766.1 putative glycoside hydrolase [Spirochaetota bacterium]HQE57814.1 putative glycoside hydrolase [Spirochaetota bacterium]
MKRALILLTPLILISALLTFLGASDSLSSFIKSVSPQIHNTKNYIPGNSLKESRFQTLPSNFIFSFNTLIYKTNSSENISAIAKKALPFTRFYSSKELEDAIRKTNAFSGTSAKPGLVLLIPNSLSAFEIDQRNKAKAKIPFTKGLYFTASSAGRNSIISTIDKFSEIGINTVVFDIKDVEGTLSFYSKNPIARSLELDKNRTINSLPKLISELKKRNIYTIARIACFRDHIIAKKCPELAVRSKSRGGIWNESSSELWIDPTNKYVQEYIISLAVEVAEYGVDEIQLDYIRFPTASNIEDASFAWHFGSMKKEEVITAFLKKIYHEMNIRNTNLSIDIFGVVAWGYEGDINSTGQRIKLLAPYCDAISPMLYPSHFNDRFDGYQKPGDNPEYFIAKGVELVKKDAGGKIVRPWLQAFGWRVSNYNEAYIKAQVKASDASGAKGYLFWNASSDYKKVYNAYSSQK